MDPADQKTCTAEISDIPAEILEQIFSYTSPYRDFRSILEVSKQWHQIMLGVIQREYETFHKAIDDGNLEWVDQEESIGPSIAERHSHGACYYNKSVYVFGGCTATSTTFNDLWRFDLAERQWIRPLAMGTYPSPKAGASLVVYQNTLLLFGGWSHPTPYPLHQFARFYNQLHQYVPETNRWSSLTTTNSTAGKAGHGASVIDDMMIVFGGSKGHFISTNDVCVLDLKHHSWSNMKTNDRKPLPRYGHTQAVLDDKNILIVGGCGGPNMQFSDVWLLTLSDDIWMWTNITVNTPENAPPKLWYHPGCKVGDKIIFLSKSNNPPPRPEPSPDSSSKRKPLSLWLQEHVPSEESSGGEETGTSVNFSPRSLCKRHLPETSESSSQDESFSDTDDAAPSTRGIQRLSAFKVPEAPRGPPRRQQTEPSSSSEIGANTQNSQLCYRDLDLPGPSGINNPTSRTPGGASSSFSFASDSATSPSSSVSLASDSLGGANNVSPFACGSPTGAIGSLRIGGDGLARLGEDHSTPKPEPSRIRAGLPSVRPNAMKNREKQLQMLKKYEEKLRRPPPSPKNQSKSSSKSNTKPVSRIPFAPQTPMYIHVLDISDVLRMQAVTWRPLTSCDVDNAPEETIFYSLVEGRGELIMFGGIQTDLDSMQTFIVKKHGVSKCLRFIKPKRYLK